MRSCSNPGVALREALPDFRRRKRWCVASLTSGRSTSRWFARRYVSFLSAKVYAAVDVHQRDLDQLLVVLHDSKIPQASFVKQVVPLCKRLAEIRDERVRITTSLTTTGLADAIAWTTMNGYVSEQQLNARLILYESFRKKIQKTNDDQVAVLQSIQVCGATLAEELSGR